MNKKLIFILFFVVFGIAAFSQNAEKNFRGFVL